MRNEKTYKGSKCGSSEFGSDYETEIDDGYYDFPARSRFPHRLILQNERNQFYDFIDKHQIYYGHLLITQVMNLFSFLPLKSDKRSGFKFLLTGIFSAC